MKAVRCTFGIICFALAFLLAQQVTAARVVIGGVGAKPGAGGMVNLPYMVNDAAGNQWRIYQGGWLQQQGNRPVFSQGAMLTINGNQLNSNNNQARMDDKTGELIFEGLNGNGVSVVRRVYVDKDRGYVRYVEIVKNTTNQDQNVQLQIQTTLNYGVNTSQMVSDPKRKDQPLAWVAQTGAGVSVVEMYAGKGTKQGPQINAPPGNNTAMAIMPMTIPAGKEMAFVHLHGTAVSQEAGVAFVNDLKESDLLKSLPKDIRRLVVNFRGAQGLVNEMEILRGEMLDVVELKSGDQLKGTLKEKSFALKTFYGPVQLPVEQVVGLMNIGRFRPRQLVITSDGQIFGGMLDKVTIDLELTSGQVTQIPLSQVSRMGYRKREGEPDEWTFEKPIVLLRSGERVGVALPTAPIEVQTRYGKLVLPPAMIGTISLQSEEHGVHEIQLVDGSKFIGLLSAEQFEMALEGAGSGSGGAAQVVKFPVSSIGKIQFTPKIADDSDDAPSIELTNDDLFVGTLTGQLKMDTAFDTITVNATEIKILLHPTPDSLDVAVTLWDGTTIGGQLQNSAVMARLGTGLEMTVPVSLLVRYEQPQPQPAVQMIEQIKAMITRLNADDWKERDRAEAQLVSMGPVAIGTLKGLRANQPPEAQQRIDAILKQLEKKRVEEKKTSSKASSPRTTVTTQPQIDFGNGDGVFPQAGNGPMIFDN